MVKRWIQYITCLVSSVVFLIAYRGFVAWVLLILVLGLPLFSLVCSLIPILLARPRVTCPAFLQKGATASVQVALHGVFPLPPWLCKYRFQHNFTGQKGTLYFDEALPCAHCGCITLTKGTLVIYDFMKFFRLWGKRLPDKQALVRPTPIPMAPPKDLERRIASSWRPKYGGGFAENHDLRLYRPGDGMNQIHWKLSAKTGKFIVREPIVPSYDLLLLETDLMGTPQELDRKLGRLLWMGTYLHKRGLSFHIRALTGNGVADLAVNTATDLSNAVDSLLAAPLALSGSVQDSTSAATWRCYIGGEEDEA